MAESSLNAALRQFEAVEANLVKLEKLLDDIIAAIPQGIVFGEDPEYDRDLWSFDALLKAMPAIDGWKPEIGFMGLNEIAQSRLDAQEIAEVELYVSIQESIDEPSRQLNEYRFRFDQKRRELVRDALVEAIDAVDGVLLRLESVCDSDQPGAQPVEDPLFEELKGQVATIETLMGSSIAKPSRWTDLLRHLYFGQVGDLRDILTMDWPTAKSDLRRSMYGEKEAVPTDVMDLAALVGSKPTGPVATRLQWENLEEDDFERLIFALISSEDGYENPAWLTKTSATDRGRDLSVTRVNDDPLTGTTRQRIIIQCKHWLTKSVSVADVALLREQMKLWEPPRVDVCIIATSGRFTTDAVELVEKQNGSDSALRMEMWPESHLERLLSSRPAIIAEFSLR